MLFGRPRHVAFATSEISWGGGALTFLTVSWRRPPHAGAVSLPTFPGAGAGHARPPWFASAPPQ